jgi:Tol biopolymer transport system component
MRLGLASALLAGTLIGFHSAPEHPPTDPIVYSEVPRGALNDLSADPHGVLSGEVCEGARLILLEPGGVRRVLTADFHSACEPDVSFDGRRIAFSGKRRPGDPWNIFEIGVDGSGLRQITHDLGNCRKPVYQASLFTLDAPEPWFQILFTSDRAGELNEVGSAPSTSIYSITTDGTQARRLTFNPSSDMDPFQLWDGRVLYASWQRFGLGHGPDGRVVFLSINGDGSDVAFFTGDQGRRVKRMPAVTEDGVCVFVESDSLRPDGGGGLARVSIRDKFHSHRPLGDEGQGFFHSPSPLSPGAILVSRMEEGGAGTYGIYRMDVESGALERLHDNSDTHDLHPRVVRPRPVPDGRSSVVLEQEPHGQFFGLDITINDLPDRAWLTPEIARRLRVIEGMPRRSRSPATGDEPEYPLLPRRLLGEVPVESDGSFFFEVPANTPVQVQLLDADGLALRTSGWIWARNKERRGCIGCHEDPERTPPNRMVEAVRKPPVRLTLPPERRRFVDFRRDVVPVVAQSCAAAGCHGAEQAVSFSPGTAGASDGAYIDRLYRQLLAGLGESGGEPFRGRWIHPGSARTSPLIWHILGRVTVRPWDPVPENPQSIPVMGSPLLSPLDARVLAEWIDFGAPGSDVVQRAARAAAEAE